MFCHWMYALDLWYELNLLVPYWQSRRRLGLHDIFLSDTVFDFCEIFCPLKYELLDVRFPDFVTAVGDVLLSLCRTQTDLIWLS